MGGGIGALRNGRRASGWGTFMALGLAFRRRCAQLMGTGNSEPFEKSPFRSPKGPAILSGREARKNALQGY